MKGQTDFENFKNGAAAGLCTGMSVGPMEALKVWMQATVPPRQYFSKDLLLALIKVTPSFSVNFAGVCALEFSVNEKIKSKYGPKQGIVSSAVTGAAFLTAADHIMLRRFLSNETSSQAVRALFTLSPFALWTGFTPMVFREAIWIYSVMQLGPSIGHGMGKIFNVDKNSKSEDSLVLKSTGRLCSGTITTLLSQPADSLAREMQKSIHKNPQQRPTIFGTIATMSFRKAFVGAQPRIALASVGGATAGGFFDIFTHISHERRKLTLPNTQQVSKLETNSPRY